MASELHWMVTMCDFLSYPSGYCGPPRAILVELCLLQTSRGSRILILLGNLVILIPNLLKFICLWVELSHSYLSRCYFCKNLIICIHIYIIKCIFLDFYIKIFYIKIFIYIYFIYIILIFLKQFLIKNFF